ncbi:hypothetical protein H2248_004615 [Termitomyces sp. 'cryptogamus']|nr:hypothetical protein H2248_004615 [Termitomyces sp. 'cryptogamus']
MAIVTKIDDDDDDNDGPMWWRKVTNHLNFFRVHVLYYIFTPLIFSAIFYASNGRYHIPYIDALFNCISAMTVCGLTTVNLSMLTGWQQTILFILMCLGNPVLVSWVVVLQRRHYFAIKFRHVLKANAEKHAEEVAPTGRSTSWSHRVSTLLSKKHLDVVDVKKRDKKNGIFQKLRPDMIRRMDDAPKRVNPSGHTVPLEKTPTVQNTKPGHLSFVPSTIGHEHIHANTRRNTIDLEEEDRKRSRRFSAQPSTPTERNFPRSDTVQQQPISSTLQSPGLPQTFTRTQTIEFAPNVPRRRTRMTADMMESDIAEPERSDPVLEQALPDHRSTYSRRVSRQLSMNTMNSRSIHAPKSYKHRDFGGFPMPWEILGRLFDRLFPKFKRRLTRTVTIPATMSLVSQYNEVPPGGKAVPYISFNALVGRNSAFHHLTHEEMDELGGVEYRALNALLWIIAAYHILTQLICFVIFAPYISQPKWHANFVPPAEIRPQNTVWFSIFQSVSAYTNTGMSLVDHSMVPFQTAYPMVIFMSYLILAGNTAFPVFLRFMM